MTWEIITKEEYLKNDDNYEYKVEKLGNPDIWKIFEYTRANGVIPNVTINGYNLTDECVDELVRLCGAVAVSRYNPPDVCYDAVKRLTDKGLKQCNIHMLLAAETYDECLQVLKDKLTDPRLEKLNAIVFLSLKKKGKRNTFHPLKNIDKYQKLVEFALKNNIAIGFDSCSAPLFLQSVKGREDLGSFEMYKTLAEPFESYLFSFYVNVEGKTFPCSFMEEEDFEGIDVATCNDFLQDIWFNPRVVEFREKLLANIDDNRCRRCPKFDIY